MKVFAIIVLASGLVFLVFWVTQSALCLALTPALMGLSSLVVDRGASSFSRHPPRYDLGAVSIGTLLIFGLGGALMLLGAGPP
jgi:hypothetical protein